MAIKITHQERANILVALRAAQDAVKDAYHGARDRAGPHDPQHPTLNQLYALRDSLIEFERPIQALDPA
jgi:hypothetical protein